MVHMMRWQSAGSSFLQVERGGPARTRFPDIYHEFESLQTQVRQAAQDYIISPQAGTVPLEVRNIEVRPSTVIYCSTVIFWDDVRV